MRGTPYGRYELLRKIAAGGMAEIFLARQWGEGGFFRDVVIKRLFRHLAENEQTLRMFQYEARLLSELSHPNIPQVYDLGCAEGTWYTAMEYVDGHSVADLWRAGARSGQLMSLGVAVGITRQTCDALHHAHERRDRAGRQLRIVHRDVTPHNMMLTRDGVTKLMDFGVAQTAARMDTEAGTVKGTFSYMAPEQVRAKRLDARADVFALGVVLYELTTGTRLFRGTDVQVMTAIVERDAQRPIERVPDYPPELDQVVMSALARDRDKRTSSAAELSRQLSEFALNSRLSISRLTVADFFARVFPSEKEREVELGLVELPRLEVVFEADESIDDWDWSPQQASTPTEDSFVRDLALLGSRDSDPAVANPGSSAIPPEPTRPAELAFDDETVNVRGQDLSPDTTEERLPATDTDAEPTTPVRDAFLDLPGRRERDPVT